MPEELGLRKDCKSVPFSCSLKDVAVDLPWKDHFHRGQDWCLMSTEELTRRDFLSRTMF